MWGENQEDIEESTTLPGLVLRGRTSRDRGQLNNIMKAFSTANLPIIRQLKFNFKHQLLFQRIWLYK